MNQEQSQFITSATAHRLIAAASRYFSPLFFSISLGLIARYVPTIHICRRSSVRCPQSGQLLLA